MSLNLVWIGVQLDILGGLMIWLVLTAEYFVTNSVILTHRSAGLVAIAAEGFKEKLKEKEEK